MLWYSTLFSNDKNGHRYGVVTRTEGMVEPLKTWLTDNNCKWCYTNEPVVLDADLSLEIPSNIAYIKSLLWVVEFPDTDTELLFKLTFPEYVFSS